MLNAIRNMPSSIWVLGFVSMLTDISSEMVHSLLPMFLVTTMGASVMTIGLIEGVGESTALMLKVFSGAFSDYLGRRKALAVAGYALSAMTKIIFPIATSLSVILGARMLDRLGKGVRDAPRDALIVDITPSNMRGAAFGLRQSLDTVGAFLGPLIAVALLSFGLADVRTVFGLAVIPAFLALIFLMWVKEPHTAMPEAPTHPLNRQSIKSLGARYAWVVSVGALLGLARFSDAFLVLRAFESGIPMALVPLIMVVMNLVYAVSAYPLGELSDRIGRVQLLVLGVMTLISANLILAMGSEWPYIVVGVAFWGLHMGLTQGLMATMIAAVAPASLRGTAYGLYNLVLGFAMLIASGMAGFIWDQWGPVYTFCESALIGLMCLLLLLKLRPLLNADARQREIGSES